MSELSVIIPTRNRPDILRKCLEALSRQTLAPDRFEVLVCDDGSDVPAIESAEGDYGALKPTFIRQDHAGPAAARNKGIQAAASDLLVFMNDDAIAHETLLETHLATQRNLNFAHAVLGTFRLAPEHTLTPLGYLLDSTGVLFGYHGLTGGSLHEYDHFYTCNISVKKQRILDAGLFDERFKGPAAEDIDLGYRLGKMGIMVYYQFECRTVHDHPMTLDGLCRTNEMRGYWAVEFFLKHPDVPRSALHNGGGRQISEAKLNAAAPEMKNRKARISSHLSRTEPDLDIRAGIAEKHAEDLKALLQYHYRKGLVSNPGFNKALEAVQASEQLKNRMQA